MSRHWLLVLFFVLFASALSYAQNTSNKGKDFYVTYAGHVDGKKTRLTLFLSADKATKYQVTVGNTVISSGTIPANTCLPVILDPNITSNDAYIATNDVIESNKAIHVTTSDNPISLYSVIAFQARTGGTMVLPTNTLGKEYYTYSYQSANTNGNYAEFTIIAIDDDTEVEITPTSGNANHLANKTFTKTLNKGEIYQYQATNDLSGSHIKSTKGCKSIAVYSGNTWASFCELGNSRNPSGGDNLYQQLFPVTSWGKNFVTAPFYNTTHGNTDVFRVIVSEDNTTLTVNGSTTNANGTTLSNPYSKGAIVTFFSTSANVISANKPISLAQYQTSQTCNLNNRTTPNINDPYLGDPEITVLNPVEQTLNNITVFSDLKSLIPAQTQISKYFLNVIIKTADISSFRLDGNPVSGFVPITNGEYSYVIIDVSNTQPQHRLSASGGFSAIAYGYGSVESYAYLAGANIQNFTFQPLNEATGKNVTSGCLGEIIKLKINLPYKATALKWNVNNGDGEVTETAPEFVSTFTENEIVYYTYLYPKEIKYDKAGDYQFKVTATKPTADDCGNIEELIADFTVDNQPSAVAVVPETGCQASGIQFTDKSTSNSDSRSITTWLWDFGDGETSPEQNPVHIYKKAGSFNVVLTATTDSKCADVSDTYSILINPQPVSDFELSSLCTGKPIKIIEKSTIETPGKIVKWTWNFGDGSAEDNNQVPVHQFTAPGTYTVTLTTVSDKGCVSDVKSKTVTVIDPQKAEFLLPDFCLDDGVAKFKNTSKNADGTTTDLRAVWTYSFNGTQIATSTGFDGVFSPTATGDYQVGLVVTNVDGCVTDPSIKTFTVNGAVNQAKFEKVKNEVCVSDEIIIKNASTTFAGKITKIEIYRDSEHETAIYKTIPYPDDSDIAIKYETFGGNVNRKFKVRLVAYSGESCFKDYIDEVTVKPVPQLEFDDMQAVCEADGTVLITQARQKIEQELNGPDGVYSGDGMKADGTFNPKIAGVGSHIVTYTFTGDNLCSSSISKSIEVYASPVADAGTLIYVLAGGQVEIPATAQGTNLKYQWLPATGLNKTNILNPIASPDEDTEYTLTATTQPDGCSTTSKVLVKVLQSITPPNTITPNGDNVHDTWIIKYLESYPNATVDIFNRNGVRVFASKGYKIPFDGTYQNEPLPVGVYYYIINPQNGRKTVTGSLTIIR